MILDLRQSRAAPWAGWLLGPAAWAVHHQAGSDLAFGIDHCTGGWPQVGLGVACALVALAGAVISWASLSGPLRSSAVNVRLFIGLVGTAGSGLFLLAILFQTFASLIVPPCFAG